MHRFNDSARHTKMFRLVMLSLLMAMVFILQLIGCIPQISANKLSFVLVPIVLGGAMLGLGAGAWLGCLFGVIVYLGGLFALDAFTSFMISVQPFGTLVICLVKGTLAGLAAAAVYKVLSRKNVILGVIAAAVTAPVVNTGLYCVFMMTLFKDMLIESYGLSPDAGFFAGIWFIFLLVLVNFLVELAINVVLCPGIAAALKRSKSIPFFK